MAYEELVGRLERNLRKLEGKIEEHDEAEKALPSVQSIIKHAKQLNPSMDFFDAEEELRKAQISFDNKGYAETLKFADEAKEKASNIIYTQAEKFVELAESMIETAKKVGANTSNAEEKLKSATAYLKNKYGGIEYGTLRRGVEYGTKALDNAVESVGIAQSLIDKIVTEKMKMLKDTINEAKKRGMPTGGYEKEFNELVEKVKSARSELRIGVRK